MSEGQGCIDRRNGGIVIKIQSGLKESSAMEEVLVVINGHITHEGRETEKVGTLNGLIDQLGFQGEPPQVDVAVEIDCQ